MKDIPQTIIEFLTLSERLKNELRHSWLTGGRQESVADHSFQMALMAIAVAPHLEKPVDITKVLKMVLVHDLVEAEAGDVPFFEKSNRRDTKVEREQAAIKKIRSILSEPTASEVFSLWYEFEELSSIEAKFVKALDNLEVQFQHNLASLDTWEEVEYGLVYSKMRPHCSHDSFLNTLCDLIEKEGEKKMKERGIDVEAVKASLRNR